MAYIIGLSPLDKDSTVCLVEDGKVIFSIAEERLSRKKLHAGFPYKAMDEIYSRFNLKPEDIEKVAYAFLSADKEAKLIDEAYQKYISRLDGSSTSEIFTKIRNLDLTKNKTFNIPGLSEEDLYMHKSWSKDKVYESASKVDKVGEYWGKTYFKQWVKSSKKSHQKSNEALNEGLKKYGLEEKLSRVEHHQTHAANAFYTSGFDEALIVTMDAYGSGLAGAVSTAANGKIKRIHSLPYPASMGEFYSRVTSSLGYKPSRHEGKIVGLAAYDSPDTLFDVVMSFFDNADGDIFYKLPHNIFFTRYLATHFAKPTVAAAFQKVLEVVISDYIDFYQKKTGLKNLVLSGGIFANVKANQRFFALPGVEQIFVHPNMGDGGCCVGAALAVAAQKGLKPYKINDVYWGPEYGDQEIEDALKKKKLSFEKPEYIEKSIAELLAAGKIVARFNGRMEYGPRSLGNRSILYHTKDPSVNQWLNERLKRTEFMPFAPATLSEEREKCYKNIEGAEYTSRFMTITFDCTDWMLKTSPAAVHVDGTARPQLVSEDSNESFYKIIKEYHQLTGIPSIINTSFNMHEEPIVCTPADAIKAFMQGHLDYLAIGNYLVKGTNQEE